MFREWKMDGTTSKRLDPVHKHTERVAVIQQDAAHWIQDGKIFMNTEANKSKLIKLFGGKLDSPQNKQTLRDFDWAH